jgi:class 3 adenylate cyclase
MTEPRIQYARTSDGVNIAHWTLGEGRPFVSLWWDVSHAELFWLVPEFRRMYERAAERTRVVGFDGRGTGLSDRDVSDHSLDAFLLDLEAVVQHLELKTFALMGVGWSGIPAIVYAARYPEQVTHLILIASSPKASDIFGAPAFNALQQLVATDWELYTETVGSYLYGLDEGQAAKRHAAYVRECATAETLQAIYGQRGDNDVSEFLAHVKAPTLVMHPRRTPYAPIDSARQLASGIPNARLVVLEATSGTSSDVWETVVDAGLEFLSEGEEGVSGSKEPAAEDIHTILFTDIEGSTALTERLGDARAQEMRRAHDTIVREALKGCGGSETKHTGDGIMASFPSASRAIECAVAVQRAIAERGDATLRVRIGLNAGEPVAEEADLFGTAVNLARRICDRAEPGQILVSDVVHQLAAGKGFTFADNGEATLKGFEKPVRLHEVRWRDG